MTSSRDFVERGVAFYREPLFAPPWVKWTVEGPNDPAIMTELRAELAKRQVKLEADGPAQRYTIVLGSCCSCGDPLPPFKGGHCVLCHMALQRLSERRAALRTSMHPDAAGLVRDAAGGVRRPQAPREAETEAPAFALASTTHTDVVGAKATKRRK